MVRLTTQEKEMLFHEAFHGVSRLPSGQGWSSCAVYKSRGHHQSTNTQECCRVEILSRTRELLWKVYSSDVNRGSTTQPVAMQNAVWKWTAECQQAFNKLKKCLASSEVLVHYDPTLPIKLDCDASEVTSWAQPIKVSRLWMYPPMWL